MKKKLPLFCVVMLLTSLFAGVVFVNAAVTMGGYSWDAPNG